MKRPSVASIICWAAPPVGGQVSGRVVHVDDSAGTILMKVAVTFSPNAFRLGEEVVLAQAKHLSTITIGHSLPDPLAELTGLTVDPMAQAHGIWKALSWKALRELTGSLPTGQPVSESRASASDSVDDDALLIVANEMLSHLNREVRDLAEELKGVLDRLDRQAAPDDPRMDQANG